MGCIQDLIQERENPFAK